MELSKNYIPASVEDKWNAHWKEKNYFKSVPDNRPPFTVVIPPPNVTGVLHMGHTLNETVQDILVRRARMKGFNACWVPGSDHASIATEAKVVAMLKEKGIDKNTLTRPEFLKYAYEWKEKYGGIIYHQIEKLGCSVDWDRVTFTMDPSYYEAVMKVFVDLFEKGLIYRGARMINWDPAAKTALSDEEVEYKDLQGKLYYIRYAVTDAAGKEFVNPATGEKGIVIATQRPETIMGDTAICVNPNDERYAQLKGAYAYIPLIDRKIPIIFDEYVDTSFGTGALKVTPAHDINDYNLGLKHNLEVVDTLNADGTLSEAAQIYVGVDRFTARKKIIAELTEKEFIVKEETYNTRLGYSQRTGVVVEPRISTQWFLKMKDLAEPALKAVVNGEINIHPGDKFLATYKYWLENVKDWCISRQLWWGQQIPAWYDDKGNCIVALNKEEALQKWAALPGNQAANATADTLKQDEDVLDTWFSSWLWPMEVFKGISNPGNADIQYYYPTSVLVTGQDIIFFWVARMIMAGLEYNKEKPLEKAVPFKDVYFTGMVRDKAGRKMSKQLGNSPDLLQLIDEYGADAVRFGIMISSPAGNDLLFDTASLNQGRVFNNKIWNALKLITLWKSKLSDTEFDAGAFISAGQLPSLNNSFSQPLYCIQAIAIFESKLNKVKQEINRLFEEFRLSESLQMIYSLIWDDFCSWYLEAIKPDMHSAIDNKTFIKTISFFEDLLQLLHPFMPFITEEIYHHLQQRVNGDDLTTRMLAKPSNSSRKISDAEFFTKTIVTALRDFRKRFVIKNSEKIFPIVFSTQQNKYSDWKALIEKLSNSGSLQFVNVKPADNFISIPIGNDLFYFSSNIGTSTTSTTTRNPKDEQRELLLKEFKYHKDFLAAVEKKLSNERFVQNAKPEVVDLERKKKADAEAKIKAIEESLAGL